MITRALAFDIGQTGSRARVICDGRLIGEVAGPGHVGGTSIADTLTALAREAVAATGIGCFDRVAGGMTGVYGNVPDMTSVARTLLRQFGTAGLIVADDAVTSYLGAIGDQPGVVVAIGTGLVALGHDRGHGWARIDGAGAMVGDEGAGWWIGRQGLIAALSVVDGREGGSQRMLDAARDEFGPIETLPLAIAQAPSPIAAVAGFASRVADVARDGDGVAQAIWARAADFIGRAIVAASSSVHLDGPIRYALVGGISRSVDLFEPALVEALGIRMGSASRVSAVGTALDGAETLLTMTRADTDALGSLAHVTDFTKGNTR